MEEFKNITDKEDFMYYMNNPEDETSFHWFLNHRWVMEDLEETKHPTVLWKEYLDRARKAALGQKKKKSYIYITLSPDKFLRNLDNTEHNRNELFDWCNQWFDIIGKRYYKAHQWVVECGSHGDHLHVHAICEMNTSIKHAERLKKSWARRFPNNQLILSNKKKGNEYDVQRFDNSDFGLEVLNDKMNYFKNELKGSHENLEDLGLRGSRGFLTDNSLETPTII